MEKVGVRTTFGYIDLKEYAKIEKELQNYIVSITRRFGEAEVWRGMNAYFNRRKKQIKNKAEIAKLEKELKDLKG